MSAPDIHKVAVIGAGVMGSGIAAHIANAGIPVMLLDIVSEGAKSRSVIAESAVARMLKADPAPLMHKRNAKRITTGNLEDDLELLSDCDWIIEAVIENLQIKQELYRKLGTVRKPGSMLSSNTSTIPMQDLMAGQSDDFTRHFMITHFFNPPRYMRLLEIAFSTQTDTAALQAVRDFCDVRLGKGVVVCKDTPGFIANRIGIFWIQTAVLEAFAMGLTVEEVDAVIGRPMGIPKTGVFALSDLIGLDLLSCLMESMQHTLPENDALLQRTGIPALIIRMIADGYTGRKGKGGFYRLNRDGGKKIKESINLQTGEYAPSLKARLDSVRAASKGGLRALVSHEDKGGQYAWRVLSQVLSYAALLVPEIAGDVQAVDRAMKLGYNWKYGPFELVDQLGAAEFADRLAAEGLLVPPLLERARDSGFYQQQDGRIHYLNGAGETQLLQRDNGVLLLSDIKLQRDPLAKNASASLWDIGDGVVCLEFTSKMNALDPQILEMVNRAVALVQSRFKALVIYNEGNNFSVGANLDLLLSAANIAAWQQAREIVEAGQDAYKRLKFAPFPVVGAPSGMALGGGCEILLHCDAIQAHAETYIGLVEVGVGLIPGWGGCKEMLLRWINHLKRADGPLLPVVKCFEMISTAQVAKSAQEAQGMLILRSSDGITMNRDRLLVDAKAKALAMVDGYEPPEAQEISLPGLTARTALAMTIREFRNMERATPHDEVVFLVLADVLSGGDTDMTETLSEDDLLELERKAFMTLVTNPDSLARMEHMLTTGKPLRN